MQANLQQVYDTVDNVDLFIGGLAEDSCARIDGRADVPGDHRGQFDNLQTGDRFFGKPGLDARTSQMIASTTLSDIISRDAGTPDIGQCLHRGRAAPLMCPRPTRPRRNW